MGRRPEGGAAWGGRRPRNRARGGGEPGFELSALGVGTIEEYLSTAWVHHWQRDPHARGAYSYVAVGGHGARRALAEPLEDTLFFAGEAADCEGEHGTVAGALASGERAAREVLGSR